MPMRLSPSKLAHQIAHSVGVRVTISAARVALTLVLLKTVSQDLFGIYNNLMATYTFAYMLLGGSMANYTLRQAPGKKPEEQYAIFWTGLLFETAASLLVIALGMGTGLYAHATSTLGYHEAPVAFLALLLLTWMQIVDQSFLYLFTGQGRIFEANRLDLITQASWIPVVVVVAVVARPISMSFLMFTNCVGVALGVAYGVYRIRGNFHLLRPAMAHVWPGLKFGTPLVVPLITLFCLKLIDRFFLSKYQGYAVVGQYSFAAQVFTTVYSLTAVGMTSAIVPRLLAAQNNGDDAERHRYLSVMLKTALWGYLAPAAAVCLLATPLTLLVAKPQYLPVVAVFPLTAAGFLGQVVGYPGHYLLLCKNQTKTIMIIELVGFGIGVALDALLIPAYSYFGAATASLVAFTFSAVAKVAISRAIDVGMAKSALDLRPELRRLARSFAARRSG